MRIAMVTEHASPLAALGGADAGGQNVHVLELSSALAERGHEITVWTRRDDDAAPDAVPVRPGVVVRHVAAGPARSVPKDELVPHLPAFTRVLEDAWTADPPDIVHGHFWMSGMVALAAARERFPAVQTFHALGSVKRRHQGADDTSPDGRATASSPWPARPTACSPPAPTRCSSWSGWVHPAAGWRSSPAGSTPRGSHPRARPPRAATAPGCCRWAASCAARASTR
jgi:hypothetical protein